MSVLRRGEAPASDFSKPKPDLTLQKSAPDTPECFQKGTPEFVKESNRSSLMMGRTYSTASTMIPGTPWALLGTGSEGFGDFDLPESHYEASRQSLRDSLDEVCEMYEQMYDHVLCDEDGTAWTQSVGCGVADQKEAYFGHLDGLEEKLAEVKALYQEKYGLDVDDEDEDECGTSWVKTTGRGGVEQREAYLKSLYQGRYGSDLECSQDVDGTLWIHIVGDGSTQA